MHDTYQSTRLLFYIWYDAYNVNKIYVLYSHEMFHLTEAIIVSLGWLTPHPEYKTAAVLNINIDVSHRDMVMLRLVAGVALSWLTYMSCVKQRELFQLL